MVPARMLALAVIQVRFCPFIAFMMETVDATLGRLRRVWFYRPHVGPDARQHSFDQRGACGWLNQDCF